MFPSCPLFLRLEISFLNFLIRTEFQESALGGSLMKNRSEPYRLIFFFPEVEGLLWSPLPTPPPPPTRLFPII